MNVVAYLGSSKITHCNLFILSLHNIFIIIIKEPEKISYNNKQTKELRHFVLYQRVLQYMYMCHASYKASDKILISIWMMFLFLECYYSKKTTRYCACLKLVTGLWSTRTRRNVQRLKHHLISQMRVII